MVGPKLGPKFIEKRRELSGPELVATVRILLKVGLEEPARKIRLTEGPPMSLIGTSALRGKSMSRERMEMGAFINNDPLFGWN